MGTTVVAALFYDNRISIAHVGDSRLYRLRGSQIEQVTLDHSLLQELVDRGFYSPEEAQRAANKNYVTRALGVDTQVEVEMQDTRPQGRRLPAVLGRAVRHGGDDDIRLTISTFGANLDSVAKHLIQLANDNGGKDNISVVLAQVVDSFPAQPRSDRQNSRLVQLRQRRSTMARLVLTLDGQVLAEYNMNKERYTVGRLPDNDIRIDNPPFSGHHSLIINILNDSFLEDLNSTNGTYVNGKLIKKHALQHGDVITVGHHQLRFVEDDEAAGRVRKDDGDPAFAAPGGEDPGRGPRRRRLAAATPPSVARKAPRRQGTASRRPSCRCCPVPLRAASSS